MIIGYEVTVLGFNSQGQRQVSIIKKCQFKNNQQLADCIKKKGFGGMLAPKQTIISEKKLAGCCILNPDKL